MAEPSSRILLVEDELPIRKFLAAALASAGYAVEEAGTGQQAIRHATNQPPDLIILDLGLPDMDGQEVLQQLRQWLSAPVIVLSARDQEQQKILALDHGADDYLTKPFSTGELLARIRAALRHAGRAINGPESTTFQHGDLTVDVDARKVTVNGNEVHLTPIEFRLLSYLIQHRGKVLTHRHLLKQVWGPLRVGETHYLRVFMASLRRKLEADPARPTHLLTEQGVGYRLASD
jgi:two-component system, OmpR family, KDP operon response regulator KdpE